MGRVGDKVKGWKPGIMMVMVQMVGAGLNIFYKLAATDGMNMKILVAYRFLIASAFIVPLALYVDRYLTVKHHFQFYFVLYRSTNCGYYRTI